MFFVIRLKLRSQPRTNNYFSYLALSERYRLPPKYGPSRRNTLGLIRWLGKQETVTGPSLRQSHASFGRIYAGIIVHLPKLDSLREHNTVPSRYSP